MIRWPYIQTVDVVGDLKIDITNFLSVNGKMKTAHHCISVARTSEEIAGRFLLDQSVATCAALLHDISAVMKPQDMLDYAVDRNWVIDEAERQYPFLLHQRISAVLAEECFQVNDQVVLSAIECHTTLKSNPSDYDMVLFLADKLSWDQVGVPPFHAAVSEALGQSLQCAALTYIDYVLGHGMILSAHSWLIEAREWLARYVGA